MTREAAADRPPAPSAAAQDLLPDEESDDPEEEDILPSFRDIKRRTLRSLYGLDGCDGDGAASAAAFDRRLLADKSPKGSVDDPIRPLVDLLNSHPSYATLSSCSGRIALFDPEPAAAGPPGPGGDPGDDRAGEGTEADGSGGGEGGAESEPEPERERAGADRTLKGRGGWLIASHSTVDPSALVHALGDDGDDGGGGDGDNGNGTAGEGPASRPPLLFKMEPLLLHVAASTPSRARRLLGVALRLGFRESGIVSTPKRATVAVRGMSLALSAPLARSGALRPGRAYLEALAREANGRLEANGRKLERLQREVEAELFRRRGGESEGEAVSRPPAVGIGAEYSAVFRPLPDLNLWGHAAVAVPMPGENDGLSQDQTAKDDVDVFVFGGYGVGPNNSGNDAPPTPKQKRCARSKDVFCLSRRNGGWSKEWRPCPLEEPCSEQSEETGMFGMKLRKAALGPREGHAACLLPPAERIGSTQRSRPPAVAIFGGRQSPARPRGDLLLHFPTECPGNVWTPVDVRGEPPSARWGHTFTRLSGRGGNLAVIVGGRNEESALSSVHVLSRTVVDVSSTDGDPGGSSEQGSLGYLWQKLNMPVPRFHHAAAFVPEYFSGTDHSDDAGAVIIFGGNTATSDILEPFSTIAEAVDVTDKTAAVSALQLCNSSTAHQWHDRIGGDESASFVSSFGTSACSLVAQDGSHGGTLLCVCGGVQAIGPSLKCFEWTGRELDGSCRLTSIRVAAKSCQKHANQPPELGPMVHHSAVPLTDKSFLLLGGGVPSFAFGESFARCWEVSLCPSRLQPGRPGATLAKEHNIDVAGSSNTGSTKTDSPRSTNVIFVRSKKAKEVKVALETLSYLDKTYRMTKAASIAGHDANEGIIAIPVKASFLDMMRDSRADGSGASFPWMVSVLGTGMQEMPFSSSVLGQQKQRRR